METFSGEDLVPHDLVLLEVGLGRYRYSKDDVDDSPVKAPVAPKQKLSSRKPSTANAGGWTKWVAYYELKAICLLQNAPQQCPCHYYEFRADLIVLRYVLTVLAKDEDEDEEVSGDLDL